MRPRPRSPSSCHSCSARRAGSCALGAARCPSPITRRRSVVASGTADATCACATCARAACATRTAACTCCARRTSGTACARATCCARGRARCTRASCRSIACGTRSTRSCSAGVTRRARAGARARSRCASSLACGPTAGRPDPKRARTRRLHPGARRASRAGLAPGCATGVGTRNDRAHPCERIFRWGATATGQCQREAHPNSSLIPASGSLSHGSPRSPLRQRLAADRWPGAGVSVSVGAVLGCPSGAVRRDFSRRSVEKRPKCDCERQSGTAPSAYWPQAPGC